MHPWMGVRYQGPHRIHDGETGHVSTCTIGKSKNIRTYQFNISCVNLSYLVSVSPTRRHSGRRGVHRDARCIGVRVVTDVRTRRAPGHAVARQVVARNAVARNAVAGKSGGRLPIPPPTGLRGLARSRSNARTGPRRAYALRPSSRGRERMAFGTPAVAVPPATPRQPSPVPPSDASARTARRRPSRPAARTTRRTPGTGPSLSPGAPASGRPGGKAGGGGDPAAGAGAGLMRSEGEGPA